MSKAFVLGNGRSRLGLDLAELKSHGKIFGCNALYRDFTPNVLVATDPGISAEIENSGYPEQHEFYTRKPNHPNSCVITKNYGYSSGPVALTLAAVEGHKKIYMIGFDFSLPHQTFNNVYAGSAHYKPAGSQATYSGNWEKQIFNIAREFENIEFYRVGNVLIWPESWNQRHNLKSLDVETFLSQVNNVSWQKSKE